MCEWWPAPINRRSKRKNVMVAVGESRAGRLGDAAAAVDTRDCESNVSDCSEVSHTDV